jgi:cell division protein FtsI/penicillin-binding protein 2
MVTAIGAIANDGKMMAPHVVKAMVIDGKQYNIDPVVVGTPVSAETAHTLTTMLVNSLENEASNALVEGYSLAGKTGTGEIATPLGVTRTPPPTHPLLVGAQLMILNSWFTSGWKSLKFPSGVPKLQPPFSQIWSATWSSF